MTDTELSIFKELAAQLRRIADMMEAEHGAKVKRAKREPAPLFAADSEPFSLAVEMFHAIYDPTEPDSPSKLQAWARDFDLMLRIDKRDRAQLKRAITFATMDTFWSRVILSPRNLRKNWDRIAKAMSPAAKAAPAAPAQRSLPVRKDL